MCAKVVETKYLELANGRQLAYCDFGDPEGQPIFYFHGSPGSRFEAQFSEAAGKKHGYRVIALDRPGLGDSDRQPSRRVLDWPRDVAAAADQLGFESFGVIGVSGGGAYALACAHALAERLESCTLMGSWAPVAEDESLWQAMAPLDRFFGRISGAVPLLFYVPFSMIGLAAKWLSPQAFIKYLDSSMCEADRRLMQEAEMAAFFAHDIREAFRQGVRGPADDAILLYQDWGFGLADIESEVRILHGSEDRFAPISFARTLERMLPRSTLEEYPGEGHLFVVRLFEELLGKLSQ